MHNKLLMRIICTVISLAALFAAFGCSADDNSAGVKAEKYIKLGEYKNIEYQIADPEEVTDKEVEDQINDALAAFAETKEVTDRPAKMGDKVNIAYVGKMDGVAFENGSSDSADITIGAGGYIEGFEDGIIGMKVGEEKDVDVTFPDPYPNDPTKAGKPAVFTFTLHSISETVYPELTDEFVKEKLNYDTANEYKDALKKRLAEQKAEDAKAETENNIVNAVVDGSEISEYPEEIINEIVTNYIGMYEDQAKSYGFSDLQSFLEANGVTEDGLKTDLNNFAKATLKRNLVLECIAKKEKLAVTDEEITAGKLEQAQEYGYNTVEEFEKATGMPFDDFYALSIAPYKEYTLKYNLLIRKAQDFIIENN